MIYISSPVRAILYNCTVVKTNKKESTIDDSTFVIKVLLKISYTDSSFYLKDNLKKVILYILTVQLMEGLLKNSVSVQ